MSVNGVLDEVGEDEDVVEAVVEGDEPVDGLRGGLVGGGVGHGALHELPPEELLGEGVEDDEEEGDLGIG